VVKNVDDLMDEFEQRADFGLPLGFL
jgi:hypothetical protein